MEPLEEFCLNIQVVVLAKDIEDARKILREIAEDVFQNDEVMELNAEVIGTNVDVKHSGITNQN